jgi:hypothetical protein
MCGPFLRRYYAGVPWYYYYDKRSRRDARNRVERWPAEILASAYEL